MQSWRLGLCWYLTGKVFSETGDTSTAEIVTVALLAWHSSAHSVYLLYSHAVPTAPAISLRDCIHSRQAMLFSLHTVNSNSRSVFGGFGLVGEVQKERNRTIGRPRTNKSTRGTKQAEDVRIQ